MSTYPAGGGDWRASPAEILDDAARPRRLRPPGLFIAVCVLAIVIGALGALGALAGAVGLIAGQALQDLFVLPADDNEPEFLRRQRDLQQELNTVAHRHFGLQIARVVASATVSGLLLYSGLLTLQRRESARRLLRWTCPAGMVVVVIGLAMDMANQLDMAAVIATHVEAPFDDDGADAVTFRSFARISRFGMIAGAVFNVGVAVLMFAYYVTAFCYLQTDQVRALFDDPGAA